MHWRQDAADELAARLKDLAERLAAKGMRPKRVPFGRGAIPGIAKRSVRGFVLDSAGPQLLLPDGRLWQYHSRMSPDGTYYDARVDHRRSMHGPISLGGVRFSFLGAVIRKYNFGYRHPDDVEDSPNLCAIVDKDDRPRIVDAALAFDDIVRMV